MKLTLLLLAFYWVAACDASTTTFGTDEDAEDEEETYFSYGEYGGSSLVDKEDIYNITYSNDGEKVAFIRTRNPNDFSEPMRQLWIADKDGRNPEFIAAGPGTIDWSDDDTKIAVSHILGPGYSFIFILDLEKRKAKQITGKDSHELYSYTTTNPQYISDNSSLFVTVWGQAYQQEYERGIYIVNYDDGNAQGPFGNVIRAGQLGNNSEYFTSLYYDTTSHDDQELYVLYNFEHNSIQKILPDLPGSEFVVDYATPNPLGTEIILTIRRDYADQLVLTSSRLENFEQVTELGGHNPRWRPDGKIVFLRDVHKGNGAHNVPYLYDPATGDISRLWEDLPEFVPEFPPVSSFDPISIYVDW